MARRRPSELSGASMDSLMDTLTNVVGILIIILILVQINVTQALKKIVSELPPVSVQELQKIQQDTARQLTEYDKLKPTMSKVRDAAKQDQAKLAKLTPDLTALETTAKKTAVPLLDLDSIRKQLAEKSKILEQEKKESADLLTEQQRLKALLTTTPTTLPPKDKIVRIPNSRPVPENAKFERYFITAGQIFHADMENAKKLLRTDFITHRTRLEHSRAKAADGSSKTIYDQEKVVKHFEQRRLALPHLDLRVPYNKTANRLVLQIVARPGFGEPIEKAAQMTSRFQSDLRSFRTVAGSSLDKKPAGAPASKSSGGTVVWFLVARDGFDTYLRAREICDALGVPAGWDAVHTPAFSEAIGDFEVNRLEEPPAPAPVDPNAVIIPPPTRKLD